MFSIQSTQPITIFSPHYSHVKCLQLHDSGEGGIFNLLTNSPINNPVFGVVITGVVVTRARVHSTFMLEFLGPTLLCIVSFNLKIMTDSFSG